MSLNEELKTGLMSKDTGLPDMSEEEKNVG